jgi:hypothetical protein
MSGPQPGLVLLITVLALLAALLPLLWRGSTQASGFGLPRTAVARNLEKVEAADRARQPLPAERDVGRPPEPELFAPAALPLPFVDEPVQLLRADRPPQDAHQGEPPMSKTITTTTTYVIFLGWLAAPANAYDPIEKPKEDINAARLQKIETSIESLTKQVAELKGLMEGYNALLQSQANAKEIAALKAELEKLRAAYSSDVARLNAELAKVLALDGTRRAFAPPVANPTQGTIQLRNEWYLPVSVVIDGLAYRLDPGQVRNVARPIGAFSYEVIGVQPLVSRTLTAEQNFVIRIAP